MFYLSLVSIYVFAFLVHAGMSIVTSKYDWDLDQFMYFGSRFIEGELLWVKEFDDKSPVVQYLFSIPAFFKSTSLWAIITLLLTIIAAFHAFKFANYSFNTLF